MEERGGEGEEEGGEELCRREEEEGIGDPGGLGSVYSGPRPG